MVENTETNEEIGSLIDELIKSHTGANFKEKHPDCETAALKKHLLIFDYPIELKGREEMKKYFGTLIGNYHRGFVMGYKVKEAENNKS